MMSILYYVYICYLQNNCNILYCILYLHGMDTQLLKGTPRASGASRTSSQMKSSEDVPFDLLASNDISNMYPTTVPARFWIQVLPSRSMVKLCRAVQGNSLQVGLRSSNLK